MIITFFFLEWLLVLTLQNNLAEKFEDFHFVLTVAYNVHPVKNGPRIWINMSPNKTYKWPVSTWKMPGIIGH